MKIGIITVQKAPENYGACLQCYGLWHYIKSLGYDCEIIDLVRPWSPEYIKSKIFTEKKGTGKMSLFRKMIYTLRGKKYHQTTHPIESRYFHAFNMEMEYSRTYRSVDDLYENPPQYDVYIAGSDQIWNPRMSFINEPYFLTFAPSGKKKISYASSFAVKSIPQGIWPSNLQWLDSFSKISVREASGIDIVKNNFGCKAQLVLDPTMLLTRQEWESIAIIPQKDSDYIFVYTLQQNVDILNTVVSLAKKLSLKVKALVSDTRKQNVLVEGVEYCEGGPKEWMGYVNQSKMVITDSFHGSVFSLIFGKPFATINTNQLVSERLTNLVDLFSVSNHLISIEEICNILSVDDLSFDYSTFNKTLIKLREESQSYLNNAINL